MTDRTSRKGSQLAIGGFCVLSDGGIELLFAATGAHQSRPQLPSHCQARDGRVLTIHKRLSTQASSLIYGNAAGWQGPDVCAHESFSQKLVQRKIVICNRGSSSRTAKGEQVQSLGGVGVLLLNMDDNGEEVLVEARGAVIEVPDTNNLLFAICSGESNPFFTHLSSMWAPKARRPCQVVIRFASVRA
ncbi:hypothetical protein ACLOJK_004989 [Asimina triloba]